MRRLPLSSILACLVLAWSGQADAASAKVKKRKARRAPTATGILLPPTPQAEVRRPPLRSSRKPARKAPVAPPSAPVTPLAAPVTAPEPPAPPPVVAAGGGSGAERLTAFGIEVARRGEDLAVSQVLPGSEAADLGLRRDDVLLGLGGAGVGTEAEAAAALKARRPETRFSAVIRRDLEVRILETPLQRAPRARDVDGFGPLETAHTERILADAAKAVPAFLDSLPTPHFRVEARQDLWLRFPKGIPASVREGDIVEGMTATALMTDARLDFLAIGPNSPVWARVVSVDASGDTATMKLRVFKLRLRDGHSYAVSARVADVSGDHALLQVSPGGTLVTALHLSGRPAMLLAPEARLKIEFETAFTLHEPPSFFAAGPGLWVRANEDPRGRAFEVTHVVPGRSAEQAGIKVGDVLTAIGGAPTERLEFPDAIEKLYGPPGSVVDVRVRRDKASNGETVALQRGVSYAAGTSGFSTKLDGDGPAPAVADLSGGLEVTRVDPDSPADRAGLKLGDRVTQIGTLPVADLPPDRLRRLLRRELIEQNALTITRDGSTKTVSIPRGLSPSALPPPYRP